MIKKIRTQEIDSIVNVVIFGLEGYYNRMFEGIDKAPYCQYCVKRLQKIIQKSKIIRLVYKATTTSRLGELVSGYTLSIWRQLEYEQKKIKGSNTLFFFLQMNPLAYDERFIRRIKKKNPKAKMVLWLTNTVKSHNVDLVYLKKNFDIVVTFNKEDAKDYGFYYHEWCFREQLCDEGIDTDLFFCGYDKGRGNFLGEIYNTLVSKGVKCDFIVIKKDNETKTYEGIFYSEQPIEYDCILKRLQKANCILDLVPEKADSSPTLRIAEAIAFSKRLLSNNQFLYTSKLYNETQMSIFDNPDNIDIDWVRNQERRDFTLTDQILPEKFIADVIGLFGI